MELNVFMVHEIVKSLQLQTGGLILPTTVPPPCFRERTAPTPHTYEPHSTNVHTPGRVIFSFFSYPCYILPGMYEIEITSTAQQHLQNNKKWNRTNWKINNWILVPSCNHFLPDWLGHYTPVKKWKNKYHRRVCFSASYAPRRPFSRPLRHRFGWGKAFLTLCDSHPRHTTGVMPGAYRGRRSPARQY